jgi:1,4-alpha-glucan branching enzyme
VADRDDRDNSVLPGCAAAPGGRRSSSIVATSRRSNARHDYRVPCPQAGNWREILNTDAAIYGGGGEGNMGAVPPRPPAGTAARHRRGDLPPLSTLYF